MTWPNDIDVERAVRTGKLAGNAMIAPPASNYPEGTIVDHFCLLCGRSMASHGDDDDCTDELGMLILASDAASGSL